MSDFETNHPVAAGVLSAMCLIGGGYVILGVVYVFGPLIGGVW